MSYSCSTAHGPLWCGGLTVALGLICHTLGCLSAQAAPTQAPRLFARLVSPNIVELIDPVSGAGRRIYQSPSWSTNGLTVSPAGAHLGLLEVRAGIIEGGNYKIPPRAELVVLDTAGAIVRRVADDVVNYVWCGSTCLAFIRGTQTETDLNYSPTGTFIFNLKTGALDSLPIRPHYLKWAPFDNAVYFNVGTASGWQVLRYGLSGRRLEVTRHHDFRFSPDGRYYFHPANMSDERDVVYESRSDGAVALPPATIPDRWLPRGGALIVLRKAPPPRSLKPGEAPYLPPLARVRPAGPPVDVEYLVYDVATGRVVDSLHGQFPRWSSPEGVVPFISNGRLTSITQP